MKEQFKAYFSFSRKERIGIIILVSLILIVGLLPAIIPDSSSNTGLSDFREQLALLELPKDSSEESETIRGHPRPYDSYVKETQNRSFRSDSKTQQKGYGVPSSDELFYFDPNTLTEEGWRRLGVKEKTVSTIRKYLSKGGKFRTPEDLLKVYGLSDKQKTALLPFVRISEMRKSEPDEALPDKQTRTYTSGYQPKLSPVKLDINLADSLTWQRLPGIGKSLSARIVKFRERLGGFTNVQQVRDVYGIHDTVFQKIEQWLFFESPPRKIELNQVAINDLATHPYCGMKLAKTIIDFRNLHGPFKQTTDLKQLVSLSSEQYTRLIPYLEIN